MRPGIKVNVTDFMHACGRVRRITDKQAQYMANRMAIYTARSAMTAASISIKKREMRELKDKSGITYAVRVLSAPTRFARNRRSAGFMAGEWWFTRIKSVAQDMRVIMYRGLAKANWASIMRKMNVGNVSIPGVLNGVARRLTWVQFRRSRPFSITFINRSKYQATIQPNILTNSIEKAKRSIQIIEQKRVKRVQKAAWRSAA